MPAGSDLAPSREQCIREAAEVFAQARAKLASRSPRESAELAWTPDCGMTKAELEEDIRQHLAAAGQNPGRARMSTTPLPRARSA